MFAASRLCRMYPKSKVRRLYSAGLGVFAQIYICRICLFLKIRIESLPCLLRFGSGSIYPKSTGRLHGAGRVWSSLECLYCVWKREHKTTFPFFPRIFDIYLVLKILVPTLHVCWLSRICNTLILSSKIGFEPVYVCRFLKSLSSTCLSFPRNCDLSGSQKHTTSFECFVLSSNLRYLSGPHKSTSDQCMSVGFSNLQYLFDSQTTLVAGLCPLVSSNLRSPWSSNITSRAILFSNLRYLSNSQKHFPKSCIFCFSNYSSRSQCLCLVLERTQPRFHVLSFSPSMFQVPDIQSQHGGAEPLLP